ncbi:hypothetical protein [Mycolicibacterium vanbaalenii]|nr:hypothetical protein [Mycolicibacterium vanbaalenii]
MSVTGTILLALAGSAIPSSLIAGFFMFKVNRATATKVIVEAEEISRRTALAEAKAALEFSTDRFRNLEGDFLKVKKDCSSCQEELRKLKRRDERRDRIEDALIEAWVEAIPLLPADAEQTRKLREAAAAARREKHELDGDT